MSNWKSLREEKLDTICLALINGLGKENEKQSLPFAIKQ